MKSLTRSVSLVLGIAAISAVALAGPANAVVARTIPGGNAMFTISCDDALNPSQLLSVNPASAASTEIGSGNSGASGCTTAGAWDAATGTAYYEDYDSTGSIYVIDLTTGASDMDFQPTLGGTSTYIDAMTVDPAGNAYALYNDNLYSMSLSTGDMTLIGSTGTDQVYGFAADPTSGTLYGVDSSGNLYSFDATTGASTDVATLALTPGNNQYSLQVDSAGIIWIENDNYVPSVSAADLWSVDPAASNIAASAVLSGSFLDKTNNVGYYTEALLITTGAPQLTSASTLSGDPGVPFSFTVTATGTPVVTFAVTAGSLPAGLTLAGATGVISGTSTVIGNFTFTVTASNAAGSTSQVITLAMGHLPIVSG
jgi:Putative Ig domain